MYTNSITYCINTTKKYATFKNYKKLIPIQYRNQLFIGYTYYTSLEKEQKETRKIRHDINNHLQIIKIILNLFANTLDHSIESCKKTLNISQRYIYLKARLNKGYFVYNITNSKNTTVLIDNKKIISNKSDKINHGIGLKKYNGDIDISFTENSTISFVLLNL